MNSQRSSLIFIEMRDHEKITVVKGALNKAERMGLKGLIWFFFSGFLGEKLEMEVALSLRQANRTATILLSISLSRLPALSC